MGDFLAFRKMITPLIIQVLFWIGVAVCIIVGLVGLAGGQFGGIVVILLGPVMVRIYCELLIVVFKIHQSLEQIRKNTSGPAAAPVPVAPPAPQPVSV